MGFGASEAPRSAEPGDWRATILELAAFDRPSASDGERRAAELIAARLEALGCDVRIERERAHGGYWWPIGVGNALGVAGGLLASKGHRVVGALAAGAAAAALWDDLGHGRRRFRRSVFPHRDTWNVVASAGDPDGERTVVFVAHHDAAHSGLVFHPALGRIGPRLAPKQHERASHTLPILYGVWLGPVLVSVGALIGLRRLVRLGLLFACGAIAAMADIGLHPVVPGANDNLTAVGVLVALADSLRREPVEGVRILLLSTGSEESFSEGMQRFGERHFGELDSDRTEFVCLECLGGPILIVLEGEGMLRMRDYTPSMRESLADAAASAGVEIRRGIRTVAATDAIIALRAGYPTVTLASIDTTKLPLNYHWPSDAPDALHWATVKDAIAVCERFLRRRARRDSLSSPH